MIEITLQFPSYEAAGKALAAIDYIERHPDAVKYVEPGVGPDEKVAAAAASTAVTKAKAKPKVEPETKPEPEAAKQTEPVKAAPTIEYDRDLKPLATKLIGINPEAFKKICADMGVPTFKVLPAEKWPEALKATKEALAELEASV